MPTKVLIVEDEAIVATEIAFVLESLGYEIVDQVGNGDQALDLLASRDIDLVLLDIRIQGSLSGVDLARLIREKYDFPFVFLTAHADITTLESVKRTLPYGYIVKPFTDNDLRTTIELALFKFQEEKKPIFPKQARIEQRLNVTLTSREYELYQLLFAGKTYREIAAATNISINTVKLHLKNLFAKLEVDSRHKACQLLHQR